MLAMSHCPWRLGSSITDLEHLSNLHKLVILIPLHVLQLRMSLNNGAKTIRNCFSGHDYLHWNSKMCLEHIQSWHFSPLYLVLHESCKFNMKMCWEPVRGFQMLQKLRSSRASQGVALHFLAEEGFHFKKLFLVSIVIYAPGPVMWHKYINWTLQL